MDTKLYILSFTFVSSPVRTADSIGPWRLPRCYPPPNRYCATLLCLLIETIPVGFFQIILGTYITCVEEYGRFALLTTKQWHCVLSIYVHSQYKLNILYLSPDLLAKIVVVSI